MRIIAFSDTHEKHNDIHDFIKKAKADVAVFAGDEANSKVPAFNNNPSRDFLTWYSSLDHIEHKIFVPGNHSTAIWKGLIKPSDFPDITFLFDEEVIIDGVSFYGSPWTPTFGENWAYNCKRGKIKKHWDKIPNGVDVLITHGPPKGVADLTKTRMHQLAAIGCSNLMTAVQELEPTYHIFGHAHDEDDIFNHGISKLGNKLNTTFCNVSIVNQKHQVKNTPMLLNI